VPKARFWGDEWPAYSRELINSLSGDEDKLRESYPSVYGTEHNYLAISGGGPDGAFGAGLLAGWTAAGTRPQFTMVTGISTGALTAPFAFLGPDYDAVLKRVYTRVKTEDIIQTRSYVAAAFGDSAADTAPLRDLFAELVDEKVFAAIAEEYRKGRQLYIGTMNLDAGREIIWNIGAIADSDYPQKNSLIHDILLASASIPVAFPPVMITVAADGMTYDELHVDGGTGAQVFVYPAAIDWKKLLEIMQVPEAPNVYVIRNSQIQPDYQVTQRGIVSIAGRSITSLIRTQGIGDLYQIYTLCQRDGNNFNLAYIPAEFDAKPNEAFDPIYMGELYELGYRLGRSGEAWKHEPPGYIYKQ
jgi:predicted patatin/cPLA2 family phospholipase